MNKTQGHHSPPEAAELVEGLSRRTEQVQVFCRDRTSTEVTFVANQVDRVQVQETQVTSLSLVREGRLGFAACTDPWQRDQLTDHALCSAAAGPKTQIQFPQPRPAPVVAALDPRMEALTIPRLAQIGQEVIDLILSAEPGARLNVELCRHIDTTEIHNQAGADIHFVRSVLSVSCCASCARENSDVVLEERTATTAWDEGHVELAGRMVERMGLAHRQASVRSGRMPVLFAPGAALALVLPLLAALNARNVMNGASPLTGKLGKRPLDSGITLVDDPTLPGRANSAPYDDEGVPRRRTRLVHSGMISAYLTDLRTSACWGQESNGNGSHRLLAPPEPAASSVILDAGKTALADMIGGVRCGLLIDGVLGLGQDSLLSGAFANAASLAYRIDQGQIAGRVQDVIVSGNVYNTLKDAPTISQEQQWIDGSYCLPYILAPQMLVTTA